jgi:hypothetical protein
MLQKDARNHVTKNSDTSAERPHSVSVGWSPACHRGRPGAIPGVRAIFAVDQLALGQIFPRVLGFPIYYSFHRCSVYVHSSVTHT